jgi:dTDP-4-dehydrorhamnose 3,5-epimerase
VRVEETKLKGLKVIWPNVFMDDRGYFYEAFNSNKYKEVIGDLNFVQDNVSKSKIGTVRGLHFQKGKFAQGKLCQVLFGEVLDVAVDIRKNSPTFGKHFSIELSDQNHLQIWIPPGFAHGFSVLSKEVIFSYKCTNLYNKEAERTILFSDPSLGINWKVKNPVVSEKDSSAKKFSEVVRKIG